MQVQIFPLGIVNRKLISAQLKRACVWSTTIAWNIWLSHTGTKHFGSPLCCHWIAVRKTMLSVDCRHVQVECLLYGYIATLCQRRLLMQLVRTFVSVYCFFYWLAF